MSYTGLLQAHYKGNRNRWIFLLFMCVVVLPVAVLANSETANENTCISLYFPKTAPSYVGVFEDITRGVEEQTKITVNSISLPSDDDVSGLDASQCDIGIGLGRVGVNYLETSDIKRHSKIYGAIQVAPIAISPTPTISLVPASEKMFERIRHFAPNINTVHVVYNPQTHTEYIQDASEKAKVLGITLELHASTDLKQAAAFYKRIILRSDSSTHSLWLLEDSTIADTKIVLPTILKLAWRKRFTVFSNQPGHAKKGVLFSVYADHKQLGDDLGSLAIRCQSEDCSNMPIIPLFGLKTAINIRTASRLGLNIDVRNRQFIDLVFPEP